MTIAPGNLGVNRQSAHIPVKVEGAYDNKRQTKYEPLNKQGTGGILARQVSIEDFNSQTRLGAGSSMSRQDNRNEKDVPKRSNLIAQAAVSFDARNHNHSFLKNQAEEEPWAEIARFN